MNKVIFIFFSFLMLTATQLEAQRCSRGCRRYMDPTTATYDGNCYGYVDNINYPEPYRMPLNHYFRYWPRCCSRYDSQYLRECIHYTNAVHCNGSNSYK